MLKGRRVIILGVNSFAGICAMRMTLGAGMHVLGLSRSPEKPVFYRPDIVASPEASYVFRQRDINHDLDGIMEDVASFQPDYIIDLAAQSMVAESWRTPEHWYQTNIVAKARLIEKLRTYSGLKKYVRVSTPEVYGSTDNLIDENPFFRPSTPYAVSQAGFDMHLAICVKQYGFPGVITRFSNFYGAGQQLYRIIPRTIIFGKLGQKLPLHGGGHSTRAFIYSDDIGRGLLATLERGKAGETYHFSTKKFITIRALIEQIYAMMSVDFASAVDNVDDRPGKDNLYLMNDDKARAELGWSDQVSLDEGLQKTIEWVDRFWPSIAKEPLDYHHKP